jgi:hypothetical protein
MEVPMIPSFEEMVFELNDLANVLVFESEQPGEWGVIVDGKFKLKVNSEAPCDEFLCLYVQLTSLLSSGKNPANNLTLR